MLTIESNVYAFHRAKILAVTVSGKVYLTYLQLVVTGNQHTPSKGNEMHSTILIKYGDEISINGL